MERSMTVITTPKAAPPKPVAKDDSMLKQKEMMAAHYDRLSSAPETGEKVCSTFVPGNLNELIRCFGLINNLPEVNAIQSGLRRQSGAYVLEAEKIGHSEDVCTYVKSDIGMMAKGNIGPNGKRLPDPDVLLLSYTGCFTFMKWFELLREQYKCETIMLHTPYLGDGKITKNMIEYMVKQLKEEVIPKLERVSGVKFDIDRLREHLKKSAMAEEDLVRVLQSAKHRPTPIDAYFGGIYYIGPIFGAFRGTDDAIDYYRFLRTEVEERMAAGQGPSRQMETWARRNTASSSKDRRTTRTSVSSGRCSTTRAPWWWLPAIPRSAASTTSASATTPTSRWRRSPNTASASTPTAACRCASTCSRTTSSSMTPTGC
jgi:benzoyl-CoA reductase subunit B